MINENDLANANPLILYEKLIIHDGISKCYDSFLFGAEMHSGTFLSKQKTEFFFYLPKSDSAGLEMITERFEDNLNREFKKAYNSSTLKISNQLASILSHQEKTM